jgi:hypothetical protein
MLEKHSLLDVYRSKFLLSSKLNKIYGGWTFLAVF